MIGRRNYIRHKFFEDAYLGDVQESSIIVLSSSKRFLHILLNRGSSQLSSSSAFMRTLEPNTNLVISLKQSSIVSTDIFIKTMLGIGLVIVISLSST